MLFKKFKSKGLQELENAYLSVRKKEERIYTDEHVLLLPEISKDHSQYKEWQIRKDSLNQILKYLDQQSTVKKVLDLGCGNGWMSNALQQNGFETVGVDINLLELEQAARLFPNCNFYECDIFDDSSDLQQVDLVIISAALQYFEQPIKLIEKIKSTLLNKNGQIIIADTKFYKTEEIKAACLRSQKYYQSLEANDMIGHYFHHNVEILQQLNASIISNNSTFEKIIKRIKGINNPFNLYVIK